MGARLGDPRGCGCGGGAGGRTLKAELPVGGGVMLGLWRLWRRWGLRVPR